MCVHMWNRNSETCFPKKLFAKVLLGFECTDNPLADTRCCLCSLNVVNINQ